MAVKFRDGARLPGLGLAAGLLAACAAGGGWGGWGSTYGQGHAAGCSSGKAEAGQPSAFRIDPPAGATAEFLAGWQLGFDQCLKRALDRPRPTPGPGR